MFHLRHIRPSATRTRAVTLLSRYLSCLEVESKFVPASNFKHIIDSILRQQDSMSPNVWHVNNIKSIRDTYFDFDNQLFDLGVWFRYRTITPPAQAVGPQKATVKGDWEAKVRVGGDFINSSFNELQGEEQLNELLHKTLPNVRLQDLRAVSDLVSLRSGWTVQPTTGDECLSIICDEVTEPANDHDISPRITPFHHFIGEVEVTKTVPDMVDGLKVDRDTELEKMRKRIVVFMEDHRELFSSEKPVGKLSAYQAWREKRGL